jgi:hypothetical protein
MCGEKMCFHDSGMATPPVDLGSGSASTCADSAVSRAYDACHTLHAPTYLTSDKTHSVTKGCLATYLYWDRSGVNWAVDRTPHSLYQEEVRRSYTACTPGV